MLGKRRRSVTSEEGSAATNHTTPKRARRASEADLHEPCRRRLHRNPTPRSHRTPSFSQSKRPTPFPLTRENLRKHTASMAPPTTPSNKTKCKKSAKSGKSADESSTSTSADIKEKIDKLAQLHLHVWRQKCIPRPPGLDKLVKSIHEGPRLGPESPNYKAIVQESKDNFLEHENTAKAALFEDLIGRSENKGGDDNVHHLFDQDFPRNTLPIPEDKDSNAILQEVMNAVGGPERPRPDLCYGFKLNSAARKEPAFTKSEDNIINILSRYARPCPGLNFPFFTVQWKSNVTSGGCHQRAAVQGVKDGAAIGHCLYNFLLRCGTQDPAPEDTVHFSATVDSNSIYLYVHWRWVDEEDSQPQWEMDLLDHLWLDKERDTREIRRIMRNIFHHALTTRMQMLKEAMAHYVACHPGTATSTSSSTPALTSAASSADTDSVPPPTQIAPSTPTAAQKNARSLDQLGSPNQSPSSTLGTKRLRQ